MPALPKTHSMIALVAVTIVCGALCGELLGAQWTAPFAVVTPLALFPLFYAYRFERRATCVWLTVAYTAAQLLVGLRWVYLGAVAHQGAGAYYTSAIALLFECIPYAFLGYAASLVSQRSSLRWCVAIASMWTLCEYWRSTSPLGVPYVQIGHALIDTPFVFLARVGGTESLTFIGVLGAAALFESSRRARRWRIIGWGLCVVVIAACVFTFNVPSVSARETKRASDVAVFQLGQVSAGSLRTYLSAFQRLRLGDGFAVWPESNLNLAPGPTLEAIRSAVRARGVPLLAGGIVTDEFGMHDAMMFFKRDGTLGGYYAKRRLIPFGEYLPLPALAHLIIPVALVSALPNLAPGLGPVTFAAGGRIVGPLICYESAFPALARDEVRVGANVLVAATNDAWFARAPGPWELEQTARLVAIETGTPMVLAGTVGPSGVIDADGRWAGRLPVRASAQALFSLPRAHPTPYDDLGDAPALIALVLLGLLAAFAPRYGR